MTGYGSSECDINGKEYKIEIRCLNSKTADIKIRYPEVLRSREIAIRKMVGELLVRGKVDVTISLNDPLAQMQNINTEIASKYFEQISQLSSSLKLNKDDVLSTLIRMPNVLENDSVVEIEDDEWTSITEMIISACNATMEFRKSEGVILQKDILSNVDEIESNLEKIKVIAPTRIDAIKTRITDKINELKEVEKDNSRLETELVYYIEKLDVNEEVIRLKSHIDFFNATAKELYQGKKLGFIGQEMGREINTIGSKSNNSEMQQIVVAMKDSLEKIKEQLLNVI